MKKKLLHIGSGRQHILGKFGFNNEDWEEIRLDVEPSVMPDIIGNMTDMSNVKSESIDAIFSSHNLEHLMPHELPLALAEFLRVLSPHGYLVVTCPDLQSAAALVADDKLDEPAYYTAAGMPIAPMDILFGWRIALSGGGEQPQPYMAHRMGFTKKVLVQSLHTSGFKTIAAMRGANDFALYAVASKNDLDEQTIRSLFAKHWQGAKN